MLQIAWSPQLALRFLVFFLPVIVVAAYIIISGLRSGETRRRVERLISRLREYEPSVREAKWDIFLGLGWGFLQPVRIVDLVLQGAGVEELSVALCSYPPGLPLITRARYEVWEYVAHLPYPTRNESALYLPLRPGEKMLFIHLAFSKSGRVPSVLQRALVEAELELGTIGGELVFDPLSYRLNQDDELMGMLARLSPTRLDILNVPDGRSAISLKVEERLETGEAGGHDPTLALALISRIAEHVRRNNEGGM